MKKRISLLLLLMVCCFAQAQTVSVSGFQSGVWDADTVMVVGDVQVQDSLVVNAGTLVLFDGFYSIGVGSGAVFKAVGSETDSVVFTVADTTGFSVYNNGNGGWNGFQLQEANKVLFDYCVLQYGKAADTLDRWGGVLYISRCKDVEINHSTLRYNFSREFGGAVYANDSRVRFTDCCVKGNKVYTGDNIYAMYGGGACFLKCSVEMERMEFRDNVGQTCIGGALSLDSCSLVLDRSIFVNNIGINGGGMYLMRSNHKECRMSNLLFDDNFSGHFGGGFALADVSPEIYNVLVINNQSEGVSCNGIFFYGNSSPMLTNCIVYGNYPPESGLVEDTTQMWVWTTDGFAPEFRNCLVEGGLRSIHSAEFINVFEDIIDTDPLFVDAANHDFRLTSNSPCLDMGSVDTPDYITDGLDLDGLPRCINNRIDLGPYESQVASVLQHTMQPAFARILGNPLGEQSFIELDADKEGAVSVRVYSLLGRCLGQKSIALESSHIVEIGDLVKGLAPGVYLIKVSVNGKQCTLKTIK
ncbi:MAG: T9SS type A sorting domain-containing protein [Bacteroidales bacterium]|nr:T9SS type A sorting domain-containing protein [Bacteroidales bacterium]